MPVELHAGDLIADRYRIVRKISEGGMGTVYLAQHALIERQVAIKILSPEFASAQEGSERFLLEARAAARIVHENIIAVHDFGETEDSLFIVMEYLEGRDLGHVLRAGEPMPAARIRHILSQVCRALAAAHAAGIIHRDLKPENIFLTERDGQPDIVKVLDFGVAQVREEKEKPTKERLTRAGTVVGTPEYMAPEQVLGEALDSRVDMYAVGCILYEMLVGEPPFSGIGNTVVTMAKRLYEPPQPPSQRAKGPLPPGLEAVCLKALERDREQRYQSMQELLAALLATEEPAPMVSGAVAAWAQGASGALALVPGGAGGPAQVPPMVSGALATVAAPPAGLVPAPLASAPHGALVPAPQAAVPASQALESGAQAAVHGSPPSGHVAVEGEGAVEPMPPTPGRIWPYLVVASGVSTAIAVLVALRVLHGPADPARPPAPPPAIGSAAAEVQKPTPEGPTPAPGASVAPEPAAPPEELPPEDPSLPLPRLRIQQGTRDAQVRLNGRTYLGKLPLDVAIPMVSGVRRERAYVVVAKPPCAPERFELQLERGAVIERIGALTCGRGGRAPAPAAKEAQLKAEGGKGKGQGRPRVGAAKEAPAHKDEAPPKPKETAPGNDGLRNPFSL